ncbi:hypothetical protein PsorP6_015785 [Peronosclerospora sorghi]|uniref:Uncharacterized protein n=1 Tax=Peronosclerospora sorghi TaxID=230839 RepID=A0ACC0WRC9_9STRA|nr:hypothetical protein PsorP6_015785 [Peronosclerospora sorghi]
MVAAMVEPAVQELLNQHEFLEVVETSQGETNRVRIKCQLTQHEMLPCASTIATHLASKKFRKARDWYCHDYSHYEPYIVPHRKLPKCLYCNVTGAILNRIPSEVEKHVQGKRYKRMKQHVKIKVLETKDDKTTEVDADGGFDADAFEFENRQVIYSDDEEDEEQGQQFDEEDEVEDQKGSENDDDMAVFWDGVSDEKVTTIHKDGGAVVQEKNEKPTTKHRAHGSRIPKKTRHKSKKAKRVD